MRYHLGKKNSWKIFLGLKAKLTEGLFETQNRKKIFCK